MSDRFFAGLPEHHQMTGGQLVDFMTGQEITPKEAAGPTGKPLIDIAERMKEALNEFVEARQTPDPLGKRAMAFSEMVTAANRFYLMAHVLEGDV